MKVGWDMSLCLLLVVKHNLGVIEHTKHKNQCKSSKYLTTKDYKPIKII